MKKVNLKSRPGRILSMLSGNRCVPESRAYNWVAIKELNSSYHSVYMCIYIYVSSSNYSGFPDIVT